MVGQHGGQEFLPVPVGKPVDGEAVHLIPLAVVLLYREKCKSAIDTILTQTSPDTLHARIQAELPQNTPILAHMDSVPKTVPGTDKSLQLTCLTDPEHVRVWQASQATAILTCAGLLC